ncbi:kinase-like domain-containing protein [Dactylonectria estremocensis]|uniref:Autophagy-related protein 1 n=1 Tax=Dactylonectria estremocensis TaxID=1079267 RepID=A0A9P9EL68_9HYPO|nr:kinase-like domain-containing protein [Dactylonectria estremocensis]
MEDALPDRVQHWKLEATVCDGYTLHTKHVSNTGTGLWRTPVVERWQCKKKLGQGGFGVVWLEQCTDGISTGQVRAVKQIQTSFGSKNVTPKILSSELSAIIKFSQRPYRDYFVQSFGWYHNSESIFITMEYLPLGDLEEHIKDSLPDAQARRIMLQILQGLVFMHQSKFAHRDLKPRNILVQHNGPDWWVKISDFGTSKQIGTTILRTILGTEHYQAPEVKGIYKLCDIDEDETDCDPSYDLAVDIWAAGAIAFRMATGQVPFPGKKDLTRYINRGAPFPPDDSLSAAFTAFVSKMMSASARDRPTAEEALRSAWMCEEPPSSQHASLASGPSPKPPGSSSENGWEASAKWTTHRTDPGRPEKVSKASRVPIPSFAAGGGLSGNTLDRNLHDGLTSAPAHGLSDTKHDGSVISNDTWPSKYTKNQLSNLLFPVQSEPPPTRRRSRALLNGKPKPVQMLEGFVDAVNKITFSRDSKWLITECSPAIHVWKVDDEGNVTWRQQLLGGHQ